MLNPSPKKGSVASIALFVLFALLFMVAPWLALLGMLGYLAARNKRDNRGTQPLTRDRPLPGATRPRRIARDGDAARHSHTAKPRYNPETGSYFGLKVTSCTCPKCGYETDSTHRFCGRCDNDLSKPHLPVGRIKRLFQKDDPL